MLLQFLKTKQKTNHCSLKQVKQALSFSKTNHYTCTINLMHTILELQETIHLKLSFCLKGNYIPESLYTWAPKIPRLVKSIAKLQHRFPVPKSSAVFVLLQIRFSLKDKSNSNQEVLNQLPAYFAFPQTLDFNNSSLFTFPNSLIKQNFSMTESLISTFDKRQANNQ